MIKIRAQKARLELLNTEVITSHSIGSINVTFLVTDSWSGYSLTAVFNAGGNSYSKVLGGTGNERTCTVPAEFLTAEYEGEVLYAGLYGAKSGTDIIASEIKSIGIIKEGAVKGSNAVTPTPDIYAQMLAEFDRYKNEMTAQVNAAKGYSDSASVSEGRAANSAARAGDSAEAAQAHVGEAKGYADVASGYADLASTYYDRARGSAADALISRNEAETFKESAAVSAELAHEYAEQAQQGIAESAVKLLTARNLVTDLESGSAVSFNGTADVALGVTGVLPVSKGGTGATNAAGAKAALGFLTAEDDISNAVQLKNSREFSVNLASNTKPLFNGTADAAMGVSGILPVSKGGTGNATGKAPSADYADTAGSATSATQLEASREFSVNLASSTKPLFNGTADVVLGVSGTLPLSKGGTGGASRTAAWKNLTQSARSSSVTDLDNLDDGVYSIVTSATVNVDLRNALGGTGTVYAFLMQISDTNGSKYQLAHRTASAYSAYRGLYNGAWTPWVKCIYDNNLASEVQSLLAGGEISVIKSINRASLNTTFSNTNYLGYSYKLKAAVNVAKAYILFTPDSSFVGTTLTEDSSFVGPYFEATSTSQGAKTAAPTEVTTGNAQYVWIPRNLVNSKGGVKGRLQVVEYY